MKSFKEFSQDEKLVEQYNTEALNFLQRLQKSRIMKRIKHKIQRGAKLARRRIVSDPDKLMKRAIKQQRMKIAKKLLKGVSLASVSVSRKIEIGKKLDKMKNRIHKLAKKLLPKGRGSMIAFGIKGGKDAGVAFINNVKLASHLANVGDTRTLVIHPASGTHSQMDEATLKFAGLSHDMIRLSVGIEDINDIKNDFEIGFRAAKKPRLVSNQ